MIIDYDATICNSHFLQMISYTNIIMFMIISVRSVSESNDLIAGTPQTQNNGQQACITLHI